MIRNYIKYNRKELIWMYLLFIGIICFFLYSCYNIPTYANYHDYGITYFFVIIMLLVIIFGTRYDYKIFKRTCIKCQIDDEKEKEFYQHMTYNDFVNRLYKDNELDLDLMGCPEDYNDDN